MGKKQIIQIQLTPEFESTQAFFIVAGGGPLMGRRVFPTLSAAFFMEEFNATR